LSSPQSIKNSPITKIFLQFNLIDDRIIIYILFIFLLGLYVFKSFFAQLMVYWQNMTLAAIGRIIVQAQINRYFAKEDLFSPEVHSSKIKNNIQAIPEFFVLHVINPCLSISYELLVIILLTLGIFYMNPIIVIILLGILVPISFLTYKKLKNTMLLAQEASNQKRILNNQYADEMIFGYVDLVMNSKEVPYLNRFLDNQSDNIKNQFVYITYDAVQPKIVEIIAVLSIVIVYSVALILNMSFTQISLFITAFAGSAFRFLPSINRILNAYLRLNSYFSFVYDELSKLTRNDFIGLENQGSDQLEFKNQIAVQNLSFGYARAKELVLKNVNFSIKKGEIIGIMGASGAGKSTFVKILMGFIKPNNGLILCDNIPIDEKNLKTWRKIVNYVRQDYYMVHGTIAQNISLELNENLIDYELLQFSIEKAQLTEFINSLPQKEKTMVEEMGKSLSGGQKQRIAIARALYSKCQFLILDEATNALDYVTENSFLETIKNLNQQEGLTVLIIAHKPFSLRICHKVYEIKNGEIEQIKLVT
jgi:ABC-type multidrug transport system fused ATPase/permease subunit